MARQKAWVRRPEATKILEQSNGGARIYETYITTLADKGKIRSKRIDGRTRLYRASDCAAYVLRKQQKGDVA